MKFYVRGPAYHIGRWHELRTNPLEVWNPKYADHKYFLRVTGFVCFNPQTNFWFKCEKKDET